MEKSQLVPRPHNGYSSNTGRRSSGTQQTTAISLLDDDDDDAGCESASTDDGDSDLRKAIQESLGDSKAVAASVTAVSVTTGDTCIVMGHRSIGRIRW